MAHNEHSAEVAEDYRHALEDLTMNSRYEITNLTVVARENTEHALAISEALQDHIKKVIQLLPPFPRQGGWLCAKPSGRCFVLLPTSKL